MTETNTDFTSGIYTGELMHQRNAPFYYRFKYGIFSIKVDIDQIETQTDKLRWLSLNGFNLLSLNYKDHGARDGQAWRQWFDTLMQNYGMQQPAARVELLCLPRVLGYSFNPLAMWFAYDDDNHLIATVAEVSNTFGQWHHYVLYQQGQPLAQPIYCNAEKVFHVSPFINMKQHYHFRFYAPQKTYRMLINEYAKDTDSESMDTSHTATPQQLKMPAETPLLIASQVAKHLPLTDRNLMRHFLMIPWQSLKVIGLIHWWALKIWLRGGKFHKTPTQLRDVNYSHSAMKFNQQ